MKKQACFFIFRRNAMCENKPINFEQALQNVKDQFQFDFVALALVQPAQFRFVLKWEYVLGNRSERYKRIVLQTGKGIAGNVFKTGKSLRIENVGTDLSREGIFNYPIVAAEALTSFGAIPLYKSGRVKGVLLGAFRNSQHIMTSGLLKEFEDTVGEVFGPYYNKEMVTGI